MGGCPGRGEHRSWAAHSRRLGERGPGHRAAELRHPGRSGHHDRTFRQRASLLHPANGKPEDRAELRLVVNAGSVLEDDDQRGLAHFVEHMAFNGTKNFPKQDIVNFMESIGMRFGAT